MPLCGVRRGTTFQLLRLWKRTECQQGQRLKLGAHTHSRSSPLSRDDMFFHGVSAIPARWLTTRAKTNKRSLRRFR